MGRFLTVERSPSGPMLVGLASPVKEVTLDPRLVMAVDALPKRTAEDKEAESNKAPTSYGVTRSRTADGCGSHVGGSVSSGPATLTKHDVFVDKVARQVSALLLALRGNVQGAETGAAQPVSTSQEE
jgi:hypothetical protein